MKKIIKMIGFSLLLVLICSVSAFADTRETKINVDKDYTNAVFSISWENTDKTGSVELTSPDGTVYSAAKTPDVVYEAAGEAIVNVGTPAKGEWGVKVTGDALGKILVEVGQIPNGMYIDTFEVTEKGDNYSGKYSISDCPEQVNIEVFADTDNKGMDGQQVYSGVGAATGEFEFNLGGLKPGEYHFYMRVSKDGVFKSEYSDSVISYQNKNSQTKVKDVVGGKYNAGYYISWTNENENEIHVIYVWDENMNLIYSGETEEGDNLYYGDFTDNDNDKEKVYIAVVSQNSDCNYDKIEVAKDTNVAAEVKYDIEGDNTNHKFITADVTFTGKCIVRGYLNDEMMLEEKNAEPGKYKVNMSDGQNTVKFSVTDEKGNVITFTKELYVDTVAPALSVTDDIDNLVTAKDYVYISGYSEAGAILTLNDKEISMKKGYFNEKVSLKYGNNKIKLVATDIAGNESHYTATVNYEITKKNRIQLYIIAVVVIILLIIYLVVFIKGLKRRGHNPKPPKAPKPKPPKKQKKSKGQIQQPEQKQ